MKTGVIYRVREGPIEYAVWSDAEWIRRADVPGFHIMKTIEIMPRELTVHVHAIQKPKDNGNHD